MLSALRSRVLRAVLGLLAIAGPLAGAAPAAGTAPAIGAAPRALARPAGITVPAPPADVAEIRAVEMPVLQQIDVPAAWRASRGKGVIVAVLDTGADGSAPDLAGQVITGPDYAAGVDPPGYHLPRRHGTYIASLIAGHGRGPGDTMGVVGVAPDATILSVRVIPDDTEPGLAAYNQKPKYADAIGQGIRYAVSHGAKVINMSLSAQQPTAALRAAIAYAITRGVVVVASAGNSGTPSAFAPYLYPASFPGVIAVAAVNSAGARASFSQQNSSVIVAAPGVDVVGAGPDGQYIAGDGTSPSAALVSGVAALIRARYPGLAPSAVEQAIITTTSHRPAAAYSVDTGFGEVDAAPALAAASVAAQDANGSGDADGSNLSDGVPIPGLSMTASAGKRLARSLAPIGVTHRDEAHVVVYGLIATVAAVLAAIALAAMIVFTRRSWPRRAGLELANMPPGDDLIS
ncbi:MAG: peptidase and in kexin sedolisin [Actinomycetia bacterium]|nr:peptidase and in kexin sedolisin [Actinomycetes bacterium]